MLTVEPPLPALYIAAMVAGRPVGVLRYMRMHER
jgi:hypothetical protein